MTLVVDMQRSLEVTRKSRLALGLDSELVSPWGSLAPLIGGSTSASVQWISAVFGLFM